jgi:hypothetical protein
MDLLKTRKDKYRQEQRHIDYLLAKGLHPIEIADELIHIMLEIMTEGLRNQYPTATDDEILRILRQEIETYEQLKKTRKKRYHGGI